MIKTVRTILAIETSMDDTCAAVVRERQVCSNVIASQVKFHEEFGGTVPHVARRKHQEWITPTIEEALRRAGMSVQGKEIEAVAVTYGPGLAPCLEVGIAKAKQLARDGEKPLLAVDHMEGHLLSVMATNSRGTGPMSDKKPKYPVLALLISGGHTQLVLMRAWRKYEIVGETLDDAAGEALDKAAKLLDLGYPGGVVIDRMARDGNPEAYGFPRAMKDSPDFSFSGLKTSLLVMMKKRGKGFAESELPDVVASYQEAVVDVLVEKTLRAARENGLSQIVICGGVAANSRLREKFSEAATREGMELFFPPMILCTDNAAMVAALGEVMLENGRSDSLDLNAVSRWPLVPRFPEENGKE